MAKLARGVSELPAEGHSEAQELVSIIEIARDNGVRAQTIHKIAKRLGIETVKVSRESSRGQKASHVTSYGRREIEQQLLRSERESDTRVESQGVFYLVLLEPRVDPARFKVGFTTNLDERLRSHRTVAPYLEIVKTWPCKMLWERTAIECISSGSERIYTEIFRCDNIQRIVEWADQFFNLMPRFTEELEGS